MGKVSFPLCVDVGVGRSIAGSQLLLDRVLHLAQCWWFALCFLLAELCMLRHVICLREVVGGVWADSWSEKQVWRNPMVTPLFLPHSWYHFVLGFDNALYSKLKEFTPTHSTMVSVLGNGRWYHQIREPRRFGEITLGDFLSRKDKMV